MRSAAHATQLRCTLGIRPWTGTAQTGATLATSPACGRRLCCQERAAGTPRPCRWQSWGGWGAHPWVSRATVVRSCHRPCHRESPVLQYDQLVEQAQEGRLLHLDCCRGRRPWPAIAATVLRGSWATCCAPSMTLTPTGSSSASDISSLLPGPGGRRAPPLPPQRQRVVTPVTLTHTMAATDYLTKQCPSRCLLLCGSSSMRHLFCMYGR